VPPGRRTLGYRDCKDRNNGAHYEVDPDEAAFVRHIFDLYVHEGFSGDAIAARLTSEGSRTWHTSSIGAILRNTAYIGQRNVQASAIEPIVRAAVERALNNPALIAAELDRRRESTSAKQADRNSERQHYAPQVAQCDKDLKRWEAAYLGEAIDLADFKAKKAEVDARRASAEQELSRLDAEQCAIEQNELEITSLMEYCVRVRSELLHFTLEEKRRALEALSIMVVWYPEKPPGIHGSILVTIATRAPQ
jgi:hypothetical protein